MQVRSFVRTKKRNHEYQASNQKEDTAEHRPKAADARDAKAYRRNYEQYPADKVNLIVTQQVYSDFICRLFIISIILSMKHFFPGCKYLLVWRCNA